MGSLMQLPVFAASIECLAAALRPLGFDLLHLLSDDSDMTSNYLIKSMVLVTSAQIALVDVLREVGVEPDGMLGLSVGENGE